MGLHLSAQDVAALEARTEGWIVGLQLAALSMQGRDDVAGFISALAGAELRGDALPSSGAVAPATWQPSGWLLYAAPASTNGTGSSNTTPVLFSVAPGRTDAHRVGDLAPVFAPAERDDGVLLTLARAENYVLVRRPVDPSRHVLAEERLGVSVSGAYSARARTNRARGVASVSDSVSANADLLLMRNHNDLRCVGDQRPQEPHSRTGQSGAYQNAQVVRDRSLQSATWLARKRT
jgi:hypothetical protein